MPKLVDKYQYMGEIGLISKFRNAKIPHRIQEMVIL